MSVTSLEDRKECVREANHSEWLEGDIDEDVYSADYVLHDPIGDHDLDDVVSMIEAVRSGTSDLEFSVDDLLGEDDEVVLRYTMSGTNTGPSYLTEEPTGKSWEPSAISIYRFDYLGVMQQLGLLPEEPVEAS